MPYASVAELPPAVKTRYSGKCQRVFRGAFNATYPTQGEETAFKVAHAAARRCQGGMSEALLEHLPGKHDQLDHGRGGSASSMLSGAASFRAAGGKVLTMRPGDHEQYQEVMGRFEQTEQALESRRPFTTTGDEYTRRAIENIEKAPGASVIVAHANGAIAGAVQYKVYDEAIHINYLGSTGIIKGTGSALVARVMRQAAERGVGLDLSSDESAIPFWRKMGFDTKDSPSRIDYLGLASMTMSAEDVVKALS